MDVDVCADGAVTIGSACSCCCVEERGGTDCEFVNDCF